MKDYYGILGVSPKASYDEIRRAYRRLAKQYHPDLNPYDPYANEKFKEINEAYEVLSDPYRRASYDLDREYAYSQQAAGSYSYGGYSPGASSRSYGQYASWGAGGSNPPGSTGYAGAAHATTAPGPPKDLHLHRYVLWALVAIELMLGLLLSVGGTHAVLAFMERRPRQARDALIAGAAFLIFKLVALLVIAFGHTPPAIELVLWGLPVASAALLWWQYNE